jgi:hypothetical protein
MTSRKALGRLMDAIGEHSARFAGWCITRALTLNPEPPQPPSASAVQAILTRCTEYYPSPEHVHAATIVQLKGLPVFYVPASQMAIGKDWYHICDQQGIQRPS